MTGLAQVLDENRRLRKELETQKALTAQFESQAHQSQHRADQLTEQLAAVTERAEYLEKVLALQKWKQEQPASERFVADGQEILPFEGPAEPPPRAPVLADDDDDDEKKSQKRRGKPKRRRLQDLDLPKRPVTCRVDPEATCTKCGGPLQVFATAKSYRLNWVPGHFVVDELAREKCSCPSCPGEGVLIAPLPCAIPRAMCGDSLLTRVLIDKFGDHIPLNRQVTRMQREGIDLGTATLSSWVRKGAELLKPLVAAIRKDILSGEFVQGDDTGFPVQDGGGKPGQLKKGRLWVFSDQQQAFYAFSPTKEGKHPRALLAGFGGVVALLDGGSEFNEAVRELGLERAGCWSHLRRYFFECLPHHPQQARLALVTIKDLFALERRHRQLDATQRLVARREESLPLVNGLFDWIRSLAVTVRPKSSLGRAVTYALNQERFMRQFLDYPQLPLHNNLAELMLRQPIVGRKNWLFAGSEGGAEAACIIFTVLASCRLQGIDPHTYLVDLFERILDHPINRISELIPRCWRPRTARE